MLGRCRRSACSSARQCGIHAQTGVHRMSRSMHRRCDSRRCGPIAAPQRTHMCPHRPQHPALASLRRHMLARSRLTHTHTTQRATTHSCTLCVCAHLIAHRHLFLTMCAAKTLLMPTTPQYPHGMTKSRMRRGRVNSVAHLRAAVLCKTATGMLERRASSEVRAASLTLALRSRSRVSGTSRQVQPHQAWLRAQNDERRCALACGSCCRLPNLVCFIGRHWLCTALCGHADLTLQGTLMLRCYVESFQPEYILSMQARRPSFLDL